MRNNTMSLCRSNVAKILVLLLCCGTVATRTAAPPHDTNTLCEGCDDTAATTHPPQTQAAFKSLVQYWAPRIYHDTDSSFYLGEYITKVRCVRA